MPETARVGLIGSGDISLIHARAVKQCSQAELRAVCSPTAEDVDRFTARFQKILHRFTDHRRLLDRDALDRGVVGSPNHLDCAPPLGGRGRRKTRGSGKTGVPEPLRGGPDGRTLPRRRDEFCVHKDSFAPIFPQANQPGERWLMAQKPHPPGQFVPPARGWPPANARHSPVRCSQSPRKCGRRKPQTPTRSKRRAFAPQPDQQGNLNKRGHEQP